MGGARPLMRELQRAGQSFGPNVDSDVEYLSMKPFSACHGPLVEFDAVITG